MAHGDARVGKWRENWRMEWVASTLYTTSEHGVSSITTADAHTSAACSRLNWRPRRFKWTRPFRRKTKSGFCACAITFQTQSTTCYMFRLLGTNLREFRGRLVPEICVGPTVTRCYLTPCRWHLGAETCSSWHVVRSVFNDGCFVVF
jgi:hypothetical protein